MNEEYDKYGRVIAKRYTDHNGNITRECIYDYNYYGDVTSETWYEIPYSKDGEYHPDWRYYEMSTEYDYDSSGRLTQQRHFSGLCTDNVYRNEKILSFTQNYQYNNVGQVTSTETIYADDGKTFNSYYKYDSEHPNGICYKTHGRNPGTGEWDIIYNSMGGYTERKYDLRGNITMERVFDANERVAAVKEYKYGNLVSNEVASEMTFNGKTYTFNAGELKTIVGTLNSSNEKMSKILSSINSTCSGIAGTVSSEDSGLGGYLNGIGQQSDKCSGILQKLLSNLSTDINNYISQTVNNENTILQDINSTNEALDEISARIDAIN